MRFRSMPGLLLLGFALLFLVPSAVRFYTDWLWFRELGYEGVFLRTINAQALVFALTFLFVFLFVFGNLRFARRRTAEQPHVVLGHGADGSPIALEGRRLAGFALPAALIFAMLVGLAGASKWLAWLSYFHAEPFGLTDPLFGREVAFYVFGFPIYQALRQQALIVTLVTLAGCGVYYVFSGSFVLEARPGLSPWPRLRLITSARRHLSVLAALTFLLLAWGAWLEIPNTLLTPTPAGVNFGASYADVYAGIPFLRAAVGVLLVGAGLTVWHGFGRRNWPMPLAVALYLGVSVTGSLYASAVQRFVVTPNEQAREQPFIVHNIRATRHAYALDRVQERELSGDAELTTADIIDNAGTIQNVRLWDHQPLLQTFAQIQEIRTYYDFLRVDNDRYTIDGTYRQVMLSVRELNTENMPNRSWVNERLTFTHGHGLTLGPVNEVTTEGLPVLFIRDLPPVSTVDLGLEQPAVYYGELSNSYVLVKTRQLEFDYPRGEDNQMTTYAGTGGVPVGSILRRLMFAIRFATTNILVSDQITGESRIMYHRQIGDRVRLLAPFLSFDSDPYPVISGGRLFWLCDAYTTTANYPYSTPRSTPELNYIRNAVKVVIDAYNGDVSFYLADPDDPLARTIGRIFPGLMKPLDEMAPDLRAHVRYPEDILNIQAQVYATYHMTNPQVFYNREDQWSIPVLDSGQNSVPMEPYYTIMTLPGERKAEFIQMLPFTPRAKDNLAAWLVARSDGTHYGQLIAFQFPKQKIVFGPRQIIGRINQDQAISPQITLWSQQGSEVIWGTLLVIPVNESLLYVRPLYLRSRDGRIPELKRVIVAYQNRIVMRETLTLALAEIFDRRLVSALAPDLLASTATSVVRTSGPDPDAADDVPEPGDRARRPLPAVGATFASLAAEAKIHSDNADQALRDGDLATYAAEVRKLQAVIERMQLINE